MTKRLSVVYFCLGAMLSGVVAGDEMGWFLDQPADSTKTELGAELLLPQAQAEQRDALSLRAGYRFSDAFTVQATIRDIAIDFTPGQTCASADFACMAASERAIDGASGYSLSLMPALLLNQDLAIYGRLGVQGWDVEANGDPSVTKSDLLFGVGIGYDISNPLRLQLEYRSLDLDIKLTSIGFSWRF